jgi:hypothetical protein
MLFTLDIFTKANIIITLTPMSPLQMFCVVLEAQMDKLNGYVTAKDMSERWDVSVRQVQF